MGRLEHGFGYERGVLRVTLARPLKGRGSAWRANHEASAAWGGLRLGTRWALNAVRVGRNQ